jgi:hypothetical protein
MIEKISKAAVLDFHLARLLSVASEYAQIYLYAKQRQKGCDGMGELATIKEEFRDVVDKVIEYSKEKEYISEVMAYDIDLIADEVKRLSTDVCA